MELSQHQKDFFDAFGYLVFRQLFSPVETEEITEAFEYSLRTFGGGEAHDGNNQTNLVAFIDRTERLSSLLDDPRIVGIASALLGANFNYASGDGHYYVGDTGWHPDAFWGESFSLKMAFYLDPVRRDTGCLRVLPGSHRPDSNIGYGKIQPAKFRDQFGIAPRDFPGVEALESDPGDLVVFNHDLWHAAFGGGSRRRMFTINLTRHGNNAHEKELAQRYFNDHSPGALKVTLDGGMYDSVMLRTAGPERLVHLEEYQSMHDERYPRGSSAKQDK